MTLSLLLEKPMLGPCKVDLRPYQIEAIDAIRDEFRRVRSTLLILPTGTGKTITFGMIARRCLERPKRCLILAHRGELIDQAVAKLDFLGVEAAIEKAESQARAAWEPDCVVASVQTLKGDRLQSWPSDYFDLIVTDEAHHATAESYRRIYRHFSKALHLGVTATADRADEESLGQVFESVAYEMTLWDAMTAEEPGPYLSRLLFTQCDLDIDLRGIRKTAEDYNLQDLIARITPMVNDLANAIKQEVGTRPTIVFTPDVASSQAMASALNAIGVPAQWVSGDDLDRKRKVGMLESGETQVLCNCALLTEGFDCPRVAAIVLCRPTKSRALYAQMVGRGTRLCQGKENCLVVDFNYLTESHDLVVATELFDSTGQDAEVGEIAAELIKKQKGLDLMAAIEQAEKVHKERAVVRIQAREKQMRYARRQFDPASVAESLGLSWRGPKDAKVNKATEGQVGFLTKLKVDGAERMSKNQASTMISFLKRRMDAGLASHKQVSTLISFGVDPAEARAMPFADASAKLDELIGQRRRRA